MANDVSSKTQELNNRMKDLRRQLHEERNKEARERSPMYEAELELDLKVTNNEVRRLNGLPPEYKFSL